MGCNGFSWNPLWKVRAPLINLLFMWVIKSPTVMHSVSHWDLFYWPNFILLSLKSLNMALQRWRLLSASKNNYHFSAVLFQNFLWRPGSTMKQCFGVILWFTIDLCSYRPLSYKIELTTPAGLQLCGITVIENFLNLKPPLKIPRSATVLYCCKFNQIDCFCLYLPGALINLLKHDLKWYGCTV